MGLDMYLTAKTYVKNWNHYPPEKQYTVTVTQGPDRTPVAHIKPKRVSFVEEEIGYWRKDNHIHKWFVDNVQKGEDDCGDYYVPDDKLKELRDLCVQVLGDGSDGQNATRAERAAALLPCQGGFFFGGTDYDDYYFIECENTIKICDEALAVSEWAEVYYCASW